MDIELRKIAATIEEVISGREADYANELLDGLDDLIGEVRRLLNEKIARARKDT